MNERVTGKRRFVDVECRVVCQDDRGQFMLDDQLGPVYGVWILHDEDAQDKPVIVQAPIA